MSGVATTGFQVDTGKLIEAFREMRQYSRRTMEEQCVTSAGWIMVNAQKGTPFVAITQIDAELDVVVRDPKPRSKFGKQNNLGGLPWTEGMMIALQRTNKDSPYSKATGNRWPLAYPKGMKGAMRWRFFVNAAERMKAARHSSTHFLQAGFSAAIRACFTSPFFQHSKQYRSALTMASKPNALSHTDKSALGEMITTNPNSAYFAVTVSNNVGDRMGSGNAVLDAKHRAALMAHALLALIAAVSGETAACQAELAKRMDDAIKKAGF